MTPTFPTREAYDAILDKLLAFMTDRLASDEGRASLKLALGEACGIWPDYCEENEK